MIGLRRLRGMWECEAAGRGGGWMGEGGGVQLERQSLVASLV